MATFLDRSPPDRRYAALALAALVQALLLLGWLSTSRVPAPQTGPDPERIQWIDLRPRVPPLSGSTPRPEPKLVAPAPAHPRMRERTRAPAPAREAAASAASAAPAAAAAPPLPPAPSAADATGAADMLERAKREAGTVDRALRKENRPYIAAPPDSPEIRMRGDMETAHDLAPPNLWEAPKIAELVNNTGDGARHTRVITGNGTYCVRERAPTTAIDTMEKLGKVTPRLTCPEHETPAGKQAWRTARDR